jgi:hypothetical protein
MSIENQEASQQAVSQGEGLDGSAIASPSASRSPRLYSGAKIAFPVKAVTKNSSPYDHIEDAEGGHVCFISMSENSQALCEFIARAMNALGREASAEASVAAPTSPSHPQPPREG